MGSVRKERSVCGSGQVPDASFQVELLGFWKNGRGVAVWACDHANADDFAEGLGCIRPCFGSGLDCGDVSRDANRNEGISDLNWYSASRGGEERSDKCSGHVGKAHSPSSECYIIGRFVY